jgi:hypothetical protein
MTAQFQGSSWWVFISLVSGIFILKVDLECKGHGTAAVWIYEAEILTPKGHVLELEYHTRTLDLLERRGE